MTQPRDTTSAAHALPAPGLQGLVRVLEKGSANEVEKENMIGEVQRLVCFFLVLSLTLGS